MRQLTGPSLALVLVMMVAPLSGCLEHTPVGPLLPDAWRDPDRSKERWAVAVVTDGPFAVGLPAPMSKDGTSRAEWFAALEVTGNATGSIRDDAHEELLWFEGDGPFSAESFVMREADGSCCAERYVGAPWSSTDDVGQQELPVWVEAAEGTLALTMTYTGDSKWCGRSATFTLETAGPVSGADAGWHRATGEDGAECS